MSKVTLIRNGARKISADIRQLIDRIGQLENVSLTELITNHEGHAKQLAEEHAPVSDIVIAAGGDGTANEILNGVMSSAAPCSFGIIPIGTGNDFLRSVNGFDPDQFVESLRLNSTRQIDLGVINYMDGKSYF